MGQVQMSLFRGQQSLSSTPVFSTTITLITTTSATYLIFWVIVLFSKGEEFGTGLEYFCLLTVTSAAPSPQFV
jgi:hypothetical protein